MRQWANEAVPLTSGTRLGPYEIVAPLGAGGMGEVYRAADSHLKRSVAIKVLPPSMATDADRLMRFQREAEVLASLNHPNIAAIYGIESNALVMELVEGQDLSEMIGGLDVYGYPMDLAAERSLFVVREFLLKHQRPEVVRSATPHLAECHTIDRRHQVHAIGRDTELHHVVG